VVGRLAARMGRGIRGIEESRRGVEVGVTRNVGGGWKGGRIGEDARIGIMADHRALVTIGRGRLVALGSAAVEDLCPGGRLRLARSAEKHWDKFWEKRSVVLSRFRVRRSKLLMGNVFAARNDCAEKRAGGGCSPIQCGSLFLCGVRSTRSRLVLSLQPGFPITGGGREDISKIFG
jgi:hypothetical protein